MKKIFSLLFALLFMAGTTGVFTSCQEDAPEINYTINITVNNDFTEVVDAINNGTMKQEAAIAALTAAINQMSGDQAAKLQALVDAINSLATTIDAKLAIIEAAMKAQTLALETKLDLLTAAVKAQTLKQEEMGEMLATAIDNLSGTLEDKLAAIEAIIESTSATLAEKIAAVEAAMKAQTLALEAKLALLETAIKNIPDYSEKMAAIEAAIKNAPDYTAALEEIKDAIAALPNYAEQLGAIVTAIQNLPNYGDQLTAIKDAIPSIPDYSDKITALEAALQTIADRLGTGEETIADKLQALSDEIAKITAAVAAGNKSQEDALAEIIALLESGALAGGGSGSGDEGGEGESTEYILTLTTSKSIGQTIELVVNYQIKEAEGATLADGYPSKRLDGLWSYVYELTDQTVTVKFEGGVSYIEIQNESITDVDLSKLSSLQSFICMNNKLTELDFSKNKKLHTVNCRNNQIQGEKMTKLMNSLPDRNEEFWWGTITSEFNKFTDKDVVIAVGKAWTLEDAEGQEFPYITLETDKTIGETITITVMKDEVLTPAYGVTEVSSEVTDSYYQTYTYKLTNQEVRIIGDPIYVAARNNELNHFRVSWGNCKVERIDCSNNQLTELLLVGNNNLVNLNCSGNQLTSLDARFNTKLTILQCSNNQLTELKLSKDKATTGFKTLSCYKNKLDATAMTNIIDNLLDASDANAELNLKHSTSDEGNVVTDAHITAAKNKKYKVFIHDGSSWKEQ